MSATIASHCHIESPAAGAVLPRGQHAIRGWVWPQDDGHFVDVRARVSENLFPGVHGFPRVDLAQHFNHRRPIALAEFSVVVDLPAGRSEVVLEVLDIEGRWSVFHILGLDIVAGEHPAIVPQPSGPLRWHEYGRALQMLLWNQRRAPNQSLDQHAADLVAAIPYPRDLRHPHLPFHGHLDEPAAITRCGFGRAAVLGWLFHEAQPIKRLLATFDLQVWQTVEHGLSSPGPAAHFPTFSNAAQAGLFGIIDVPAQLPSPVSLRLYAELHDGSLHLCSVQRSLLFTNEDEKQAYPPQTTDAFATTVSALDLALKNRGIEVVRDAECETEIARLRRDFELRAPRGIPIPATLPSDALLPAASPQSVLLATHNLNFEGAPLFLVDYATHLIAGGASLTILSPTEGPLRKRFEDLGAKVELIDIGDVFATKSTAAARDTIAAAFADFDLKVFDLVVGNTFTTFWCIHAAKQAGIPSLLYVHESTTPASFYLGRVHPEVVTLVNEAFSLADAVSFTTASTRGYHLDYGNPANHRLTPGWIDVARIDRWRTSHAREALRKKFNLRDDELLVTNIGTVCDRKGQHIFTRAVDLLWQRYPDLARRTRFVMLGGGDTPFDTVLQDLLAQVDLPNLEVHPATADYFPYFAAADLFVCSTYEESSPRVILEAMAFQAPILSSRVHGIPEQVEDGVEATLIPPGDTAALAEAMARLLTCPAIGRDLAQRARARVLREFEAEILLPRHAALAASVASANPAASGS